MSGQQTTPLWQTIMHAPMPEPAKRMHIGLGEHRHVWLDSDMRHFAHQIAEPIQRQRDELLAALKALYGWCKAETEHFDSTGPDEWIMEKALAAIAKATGEQP